MLASNLWMQTGIYKNVILRLRKLSVAIFEWNECLAYPEPPLFLPCSFFGTRWSSIECCKSIDATKMAHEKPIEITTKGDDRPKHMYTLEEAVEEASKWIFMRKVIKMCAEVNVTQSFTLWIFISEIGKYQIILTACLALSLLGSSVENTNVSYILPYAKCDLELTIREQGVLSGISYFGIVFSSHLWGFLADTWGRKKVLRLAAVGAFIFSFSSAFAVNKYMLIILRFLAGALLV